MPPPLGAVALSSRESSLRLGKLDISGLNSANDLMIEAFNKFMEDESFVETLAFRDFLWRSKAVEYVEKVAIERSLNLELPKSVIQANVMSVMRDEFPKITAQDGKELVNKCGVLLLPKSDIVDAIVLDTIKSPSTNRR